ncbi:hypothetical protein BH11PAT1_BH11PAT1_6270 [soil metagenome]
MKGGEKMQKLTRTIASGLVAGALLLSTSVPALAANDYCGASANGCEHSQANTPCAGHGAFGAFGKDNNFAGGASGDRTGYNNSTLCGNPQGSAGVLGDHTN